MLKTTQSVVALIIAAACGILSTAGGLPPPGAPATTPPTALAAAPAAFTVSALESHLAGAPSAPAHAALAPVPLSVVAAADAPQDADDGIVRASRLAWHARLVPVPDFVAAAEEVGWLVGPSLVAVALCESGVDSDHDGLKDALDLRAEGRQGERGPLQVHPTHAALGGLIAALGYGWDDMFTLGPNLAVGLALYERAGGFGPWMCTP